MIWYELISKRNIFPLLCLSMIKRANSFFSCFLQFYFNVLSKQHWTTSRKVKLTLCFQNPKGYECKCPTVNICMELCGILWQHLDQWKNNLSQPFLNFHYNLLLFFEGTRDTRKVPSNNCMLWHCVTSNLTMLRV